MSSTVRVIVTKIPNHSVKNIMHTDIVASFIQLQNSLTCTASQFPGFIESNSYWKINDVTDSVYPIINSSLWENENDWKFWYESLERKHILRHKGAICKNINVDICRRRKEFNEIPLL